MSEINFLNIDNLCLIVDNISYIVIIFCIIKLFSGVECAANEEQAFKDIDYAFLVGAMPRKEGMERKDLLAANVKIFKSQGQALAKWAKPTVKVFSFYKYSL